MKKKIISLLTALSMTFMLFTMPNIAEAATSSAGGCNGDHTGMIPWTDTTKLPTSSGSYYLADDVAIAYNDKLNSSAVELKAGNDITICLNGHKITTQVPQGKTLRIFYINGGSLTLCDCVGTGMLTGAHSSGIGGAVLVGSGSTFTMNGGIISGNYASSGGGVYINGIFTMNGGIISGNYAGSGGGVYNNGTFTMNGKVDISGNTKTDGNSVNNVYLTNGKTITIGSSFDPASTIGVNTQTAPANCQSYVDVTETCSNVSNRFTADINGQNIVYNGGKVQLTKAHDYSTAWTTDDTNHWHKCQNCDAVSDEAQHTGGTTTCEKEAVCTICGQPYGGLAAHTEVTDEAVEPNCTTEGKTAGSHCDVCGEVLTAQTIVSAKGHSYGSWTIKNAPSLTAAGTAERVCSNNSSHTETKDVPVLSANIWTKSENTKPTINTDGSYTYTSTEYGNVTVTVPKLTDSSWTKAETKKPTVNENGEYTYTSGYGNVKVDVPKLSDPVWTKTEHIEADEEKDGKDVYESVYGTVEVTLPALGHTHNLTQVAAKEATCTATGNNAYWTCGCGKYFSDENGLNEIAAVPTIPTLGHNYADGKCTRCGDTDSSHVHNFVNGVCVCGAADPNYVPPHEHTFVNGTCECGETDPAYNQSGSVAEDVKDTAGTNAGLVQDNTLIENVLTDEDKTEIENGHSFEIVLEVTDIENSVPLADVTAASSVLSSGEKIGVYVDLSLYKIKDNNAASKEAIHNANGQIGITLTIPESIYAADRTYSMIRVHGGIAENLGGTYDKATRSLTFYTDKFSTYAIAFTASSVNDNSPTIPTNPTAPTTPTRPSTPTTGGTTPSTPSVPVVTPTVTEAAAKEEEIISDDEPYIEDVSSGAGVTEDSESIDLSGNVYSFWGVILILDIGFIYFKKSRQK